MLKENAEILAFAISRISSTSPQEQRLPHIWKLADVSPLPKKKPVKDLEKDLRSIPLTTCLFKVPEDSVVNGYVKPAVLKVLNPQQDGAVPNSSTTQDVLHMVHCWAK